MHNQPPPHDLDAERAILGAVLVDPTALEQLGTLRPEDFWRVAHRELFGAMLELRRRGEAIDPLTIKTLFSPAQVEAIGGPAYITSLTDGMPRGAHVAHCARIVRDAARRRRARTQVAELQAALDAGQDVEPALQAVVQSVQDLTNEQPQLSRELRVLDEMDRERARREARRRLELEARGPRPTPEILTLRERLARPRTAVRWRIAGWQPTGTRVMLTAQFKTGKTTMVGGLLRSLVDGDSWLGTSDVEPIDGAVALIDTEMSPTQLDEWLRAQRIHAADRILVVPVRGIVSAFDVLDRDTRASWAAVLRERHVSYVVLDCLRPVLDASGLDEHRDVGRWLVAFDEFLREAGVHEALIVHHMGHTGERARGDSRLRDWPDVEWRLVRQDENPASPRFVAAYGRDVDVRERELVFDAASRRLTLGQANRREAAEATQAAIREARTEAVFPDLGRLLAEANGPLSKSAIEAQLTASTEHSRDRIRDAIRAGVKSGLLVAQTSARGASALISLATSRNLAEPREPRGPRTETTSRPRGGAYSPREPRGPVEAF